MKKLALIALMAIIVFSLIITGCSTKAQNPTASSTAQLSTSVATQASTTSAATTSSTSTKSVTPEITWKLSTYLPPQDVQGQIAQWWCDEVAKRSNGRFIIKPFFSEGLSKGSEEPDNLKAGLFEICSWTWSYYPTKGPIGNLLYLPYAVPFKPDQPDSWRTYLQMVTEYTQSPAVTAEFAKFNARVLVGNSPAGYNILSKRPINTVEDFKGLKVRAIGGIADLLVKAGAAPTFFTMGEVSDALAKGTIEAHSHWWTSMYSFKMYEVAKYYTTDLSMGHGVCAYLVNDKAYQALPDDMKTILDGVAQDAIEAEVQILSTQYTKAMAAFKDAGVTTINFPAEEQAKLIELAKPIWKDTVNKLESQGLPAKDNFNLLQQLKNKYFPYLPVYTLD